MNADFTFLPASLARANDPQAELLRLAEVGARRELIAALITNMRPAAGRPRDEVLEQAVASVRQRARQQGLTLREASAWFVVENHVGAAPPQGLAAELVGQVLKTGGPSLVQELRDNALTLWKAARR